MRWIWGGLAVLAGACATAADIPEVTAPEVRTLDIGGTRTPVAFAGIKVDINRGAWIGAVERGLACVPDEDLHWADGTVLLDEEILDAEFTSELDRARYDVAGAGRSLFVNVDHWRAEILIAGEIKTIRANLCYPWGGLGRRGGAQGEAYVEIRWEIFSRLDRRVVHSITTGGNGKGQGASGLAVSEAILAAFGKSVRGLLADAHFRELATGAEPRLAERAASRKRRDATPLSLVAARRAPNNLAGARDGVVTVYAGGWSESGAHGSGVIVAKGGYVLTNSHVVEEAERVVVRDMTGMEHLGEVLRYDLRRDVALVRAKTLAQPALAMRRRPSELGEPVYAYGAPLDDSFEATLTQGIVSGYRVINSFPHIQSDATVHPGSSGGPLVDAEGRVLAIAVSGIRRGRHGEVDTRINFFIPIADALASLSVNVDDR